MNRTVRLCLASAILASSLVASGCPPRLPGPGPVEYERIMAQVDKEVAAHFASIPREFANHPMPGDLGFCHVFWAEKKRILKEKYGIDWKTPAEQNPGLCID